MKSILMAIGIAGLLVFYWYEYRPTKIRSACIEEATNAAIETMKDRAKMEDGWRDDYRKAAKQGFYLVSDKEQKYKDCLRNHGLASHGDE